MLDRQIKREELYLFLGDLFFFIFALWLTLSVRFLVWPSRELFFAHLRPFSIIFLAWVLVFFIADLYNRRHFFGQTRLANTIINAQLINSFLAIIFFYFIPSLDITPKITLFVCLFFSFLLILWWRLKLSNFFCRRPPERYLFLCLGSEVFELKKVFGRSEHYGVTVVNRSIAPTDWLWQKISTVVINPYDAKQSELSDHFCRLMFGGLRFVSVYDLYEDIFGRLPVSIIDERWIVEHANLGEWSTYRLVKRLMDLVVSLVLFLITLPLYLVIIPLIKVSAAGPIFYTEERIGQFGRTFKIYKFRSMTTEPRLKDRRVTRFGHWLRRIRLDELPQLLSVVIGRQSLIGPRPERPEYVKLYEREIPYYHARHLIPPGLSGWAQIYQERHPHFAPQTDATREKLSYDLYYIKNRSFWLDLKIALKTIRTILSRSGL
ncbi:MAG TPA: sugar transferase [Candidatus Paceibacterota bacterium]